ncbi:MAG: hypothetical protein AAF599_14965 [Bacteroidota bacterium]
MVKIGNFAKVSDWMTVHFISSSLASKISRSVDVLDENKKYALTLVIQHSKQKGNWYCIFSDITPESTGSYN